MAAGAQLLIEIAEKAFGETLLFEGLGFQVPAGQVVALIGPSGVGKSTLLRMIAGIDTDYRGRIEVDSKAPPDAQVPGFVFQDPRLLPWETALGNLLAVKPDLPVDAGRSLLAAVGLAAAEDLRPAALSGGMQRRVALARALAVSSRLLLLDEPFVSIDRKLAGELQALVAGVVDRFGPTVILVTHDTHDAAALADRVIMLGGRPMSVIKDTLLDRPRADRHADWLARAVRDLEEDMRT
ncbi:ABC transporter ATP-binding protein [Mesobacterium pallidum]|uniref:ABC transporter ATP-binding protein n=1 Tax=Mesobacterium pallidum TaxID=2872037 RepID=UPI001EE180BF|nr:ATP-binding cassette domain-containing protein [Mesobacterium pallidum]